MCVYIYILKKYANGKRDGEGGHIIQRVYTHDSQIYVASVSWQGLSEHISGVHCATGECIEWEWKWNRATHLRTNARVHTLLHISVGLCMELIWVWQFFFLSLLVFVLFGSISFSFSNFVFLFLAFRVYSIFFSSFFFLLFCWFTFKHMVCNKAMLLLSLIDFFPFFLLIFTNMKVWSKHKTHSL